MFCFFYGDDSLVHLLKADPRLTQLTLRDCMSRIGFVVTSSTKSAELSEYEERENLTFLKRGIVEDADYGGFRAPLERKSIYKMLCWIKPGHLTDHMWLYAVASNARREWFLHGRATFEEEVKRLDEALACVGGACETHDFDYYMRCYEQKTFVTWDL